MNDIEAPKPDKIDAAIAASNVETQHELSLDEADSLIANYRLQDGRAVQIGVPVDFGPDEFETCVGILMQLRLASDQRKAALAEKERGGIILPEKPKLRALDGKPLT